MRFHGSSEANSVVTVFLIITTITLIVSGFWQRKSEGFFAKSYAALCTTFGENIRETTYIEDGKCKLRIKGQEVEADRFHIVQ